MRPSRPLLFAATFVLATVLNQPVAAQLWVRDTELAANVVLEKNVSLGLTGAADSQGRYFIFGDQNFPFLPDDTRIAAGHFTHLNGTAVSPLARLLPDGTIDFTFSPELPPGHIPYLVAPTSDDGAWVALYRPASNPRFSADGITVPASVSILRLRSDGRVTHTIEDSALPYYTPISVLPDDSLVVTKQTFPHVKPHLVRYDPDGKLDPAFVADFAPSIDRISRVLPDNDGGIFVSGYLRPDGGRSQQFLIKLNATGTRDTSFNWTGGMSFGHNFTVATVGVMTFSGMVINHHGDDGELLRSADLVDLEYDVINGIFPLADDRLLIHVYRWADGGASPQSSLLLLDPDFSLKADWRTLSETPTNLHPVMVPANGPAFIVGQSAIHSFPSPRPQLMLVEADDNSVTTLPLIASQHVAGAVTTFAEDASGRVLIAGDFTHVANQPRDSVARFLADGTLDPDFDPGPFDVVFPLHDGGAIVHERVPRRATFGLEGEAPEHWNRLWSDGSLGPALASPPAHLKQDTRWLLDAPDGRILISTYDDEVGFSAPVRLIWLNADGSENQRLLNGAAITPNHRDRVFIPEASRPNSIAAAALRADGSVTIAGEFPLQVDGIESVLLRLQPDGSLDASYQPELLDHATTSHKTRLLPDGGAVIWQSNEAGRIPAQEWIRLRPDGSRDSSFAPPPDSTNFSTEVLSNGGFYDRVSLYTSDGWRDPGFTPFGGEFPWGEINHALTSRDGRLWASMTVSAPTPNSFETTVTRFDPVAVRAITSSPQDLAVISGSNASFTAGLGDPDLASVQWYRNGNPIVGANSSRLLLERVRSWDAGTYTAQVTYGNEIHTSEPAELTLIANTTRLINFSARSWVSAAHPQTGGFVVTAPTARSILLRAVGRGLVSLMPSEIEDFLPEPDLRLFSSDAEVIAHDIGGILDPDIEALAARVGAFPARPTDPAPAGSELVPGSALAAELASGLFTAQVASGTGHPGLSLLEFYDTENVADSVVRNVSLRGFAGRGNAVLTAGFVIRGTGPARILVRAIGPGLSAFGVADPVFDPRLRLMGRYGHQVGSNDDWGNAPAIAVASRRAGAFELEPGSRDAALVVDVYPGVYTAQIELGDSDPGEALIEIYLIDPES